MDTATVGDVEPHALQLPLNVDIIIDPRLSLNRCTSIHAAVVAADVTVYRDIDALPEFDPASTVVLFPSPGALSIDEGNVERP